MVVSKVKYPMSAVKAMPTTWIKSPSSDGAVCVIAPAVSEPYSLPPGVQFQVSSLTNPRSRIFPYAVSDIAAVAIPIAGIVPVADASAFIRSPSECI